MKTITITVDAVFGSKFQEENIIETLKYMLVAWSRHAKDTHKANRLDYEIFIQDSKK